MKFVFWYGTLSTLFCWCQIQSSTIDIKIVEISKNKITTLVCNVTSSTKLTRWSYLPGLTGTSLMSLQNEICNVSPPDSFLYNALEYSYSCSNEVYLIRIQKTATNYINNHILACRDAEQPDGSGSTWKFKVVEDTPCTDCEQTISFNVQEVTERDRVTFICRVSSDALVVNWDRNMGSNTAAMSVQNGQCATQGTTFLNNTSKYIYTCNRTVYQVTVLNVTRSEHNDMYICKPVNQIGSNWIIKVKAAVTLVTLTPSNSLINVQENTAVNFTCITSTARPAASVYWYILPNGSSNDVTRITDYITATTDYNDLSVINSTLHCVPTRHHNNMKIYCEAYNSANTSPKKSNEIELNVQYKIDSLYIEQGNEYRAIVNRLGSLSCTAKGGNPTPTLSWSCDKFATTHQPTNNSNGNVTTTLTWNVLQTEAGQCTCTSTQTGFTNETAIIYVVVLYPPSKPTFSVNGKIIEGDVSFIEGTTRNITCAADSKPSPDRYTWTGPSNIDSPNHPTLALNTIKKDEAGEYKCSVRNTMNSSDEGIVAGTKSSTMNVFVLYAPIALPINNRSILKGDNLTIKCPYTVGMPTETTIIWTRNVDNKHWNGEQLNIPYVEKSDAANYFCNVSNVMMPSGESISYIEHTSQRFYLDVLYEAIVTSFTIEGYSGTTVTKNETDQVPFFCKADSNPTADVTLSHDNKLLKAELTNIVKHGISKAGCLDAGTYICTAKNMYNMGSGSSKEVQLFVNCYPRTANEIQRNTTSEKNATITITLNVIAYPPPTFIWYKLVDEEWTLLNEDDNYSLKSSAVQSNLTIRSVGSNDFTSYKVLAENDFGQMDQLYYLSPYDKPDPPINFTHIESHTTTSSIHLEWTPGFDNGSPQTFNIEYRKSTDNVWNYRNVSDNGESTMDLLLTGLTESSQYEFFIFASNVKGNSSEISFTATTLKAIENSSTNPGALIGGVTGGISGVIIIGIVIIVIIRRYPFLKGRGNNDQDIRRPDFDDSDDEDGLVDNPMYASSSNVAAVASTSASTSTDIYAKPVKPKKPIVPGKGYIYAVVDKTKKIDKEKIGKTASGNSKQQEADVYENVELDYKRKEKEDGIHSSPGEQASKQPKLKIVNKDGLIYADLLFNGKPPGEKMVIIGDDPTPYSQVDFTKKADPLPESDEEDENK